jgi:hypothetical protein
MDLGYWLSLDLLEFVGVQFSINRVVSTAICYSLLAKSSTYLSITAKDWPMGCVLCGCLWSCLGARLQPFKIYIFIAETTEFIGQYHFIPKRQRQIYLIDSSDRFCMQLFMLGCEVDQTKTILYMIIDWKMAWLHISEPLVSFCLTPVFYLLEKLDPSSNYLANTACSYSLICSSYSTWFCMNCNVTL